MACAFVGRSRRKEEKGGKKQLYTRCMYDSPKLVGCCSHDLDWKPSRPARHEEGGEEDMPGTVGNRLILEFKASSSCFE